MNFGKLEIKLSVKVDYIDPHSVYITLLRRKEGRKEGRKDGGREGRKERGKDTSIWKTYKDTTHSVSVMAPIHVIMHCDWTTKYNRHIKHLRQVK